MMKQQTNGSVLLGRLLLLLEHCLFLLVPSLPSEGHRCPINLTCDQLLGSLTKKVKSILRHLALDCHPDLFFVSFLLSGPCGDMTAHLHNLLLDLCVAVGGPIVLQRKWQHSIYVLIIRFIWTPCWLTCLGACITCASRRSGKATTFALGRSCVSARSGKATTFALGRSCVSARSGKATTSVPRTLLRALSTPCFRRPAPFRSPGLPPVIYPVALPVRIAIPATMPPRHDERRPPEKVKSRKLV